MTQKWFHPQEYVDRGEDAYFKNPVTWTHGLELLEHCLQGDTQKTILQNPNASGEHLQQLHDVLQQRSISNEEFQEIVDNSYQPKKKWQSRMDDCGDLDLDSYLNKEEFVFESWEKTFGQGHAVSIIYDVCVSSGERAQTFMEERHKKVYSLVAQLEADRRPARVVAAFAAKCFDLPGKAIHFVIIKDYDDPIFPAIWGAFMNNASTNDWCNVVQDYFLGTYDPGNGRPATINARKYFPEDEELIIYGDRVIDA